MTEEQKFNKLKKLSKDQVFDLSFPPTLTLKRFREMTKDMPEDSLILVERMHDLYFENNRWGVYLEKMNLLFQERENQKPVETLSGESIAQNPTEPEIIERLKTQYIPAYFCIKRTTEPKLIYIDFHY